MNRAIFTSDNDRWGTPDWLYQWLNAQLWFTLDVCAERWNAKHKRFFSPKLNGLLQPWTRERAWANPPYSQVEAWMRRARRAALFEQSLVANLVPARVDTEWWDRYVLHGDGSAGKVLDARFDSESRTWWVDREGGSTALHFVKGRVDFDTPPDAKKRGESTAPFPSAVILHVPPGMPNPAPRQSPALASLGPWLTRLWPTGDSARAIACTRSPGAPVETKNNTAGQRPPASFSPSTGVPSFAAPQDNHAVRENDHG